MEHLKLNYDDVVKNIIKLFETNSDVYIEDYLLTFFSKSIHTAYRNWYIDYDDSNMYIANQFSNMSSIIKLSTIFPEPLAFTFGECSSYVIDKEFDIDWHVHDGSHYIKTEYEVYCHLPQFNYPKWFKDSLPLMSNGLLKYYPNIYYQKFESDGSTIEEYNRFQTSRITWNTCNDVDSLVNKILTIDIPYFYDVSLENYTKIVCDNTDELKMFQKFFSKEIVKLNFENRGELLDFEYELNKNVRDISNLYKTDCQKFIKGLALGTLSTVALVIYAFKSVDELTQTIIGTGGAVGIIPTISNLIDFKITKGQYKNNDCYFLWLLKYN